jgi:hypothetical protein
MTKKLTFSVLAALLCMNAADAQTKISGSVDAYYRYNFDNNPAGGTLGNNSSTSFVSDQSTFNFGMASVKFEHTMGKVGAVADLGFGPKAEEFSYADEGTLLAVKQAYIYYSISDKVKLTAGKWATHVGYEVLDPQVNKNYSMSYMFTNGPFSHTGLKADFTLGDGVGAMVGVANTIDATDPSDGSAPKTLLAQVSKTFSKGSVYLNYAGYFGAKKQMPYAASLNQIGLTASYTVDPKFSLGFDGTVQSIKSIPADKSFSWYGAALYGNYAVCSSFGMTLRAEYFGDKNGIKVYGDGTDGGNNIFGLTLSGNYKVGGLTFIPELRLDNASENGLYYKANGADTKSTVSAVLAAVYSF